MRRGNIKTFGIVVIGLMALEALAHAIDHTKGAEPLRYVWHALQFIVRGGAVSYMIWLGRFRLRDVWPILVIAGIIFEFVYQSLRILVLEWPWWF